MAFSKDKRIRIYRKLISNLYRGNYVSKARIDVEISKDGFVKFINSLKADGLIILVTGKKGRTFVKFTNKGIDILRKSFGDDLFPKHN